MSALVDVRELVVRYGPAVALDGVSLTVGVGERVALVGANGAGKSSLLNAVAASSGRPEAPFTSAATT